MLITESRERWENSSIRDRVEGREKRERIGDGHGSLCAGHRTFWLSLGFQALRMGVASFPSPVSICIWGWAALGSLPPQDNLHPQIYIEVKEFPERGDRALPPCHIPHLSFKVMYGEPGDGGVGSGARL